MRQISAHPRPIARQKWRSGNTYASERSPSTGVRWLGIAVLVSLGFWLALGIAAAKMLGAF